MAMLQDEYTRFRLQRRKTYLLQTAERTKEALASTLIARGEAITSIDKMNIQLIVDRLQEAIKIAEEESAL